MLCDPLSNFEGFVGKLHWCHCSFVALLSLPIQEITHTEYVRPDMDIYQDYVEGCLTFKNPTHHNNGNYTLEATNYLGVATSTVYGHFLDKPFEGKLGHWGVCWVPVISSTIIGCSMLHTIENTSATDDYLEWILKPAKWTS